MKIIGLMGGMSWESSLQHYKIINQSVRDRLGGQHSAKIMMYSVDFQPIEKLQHENRWEEAAAIIVAAAQRVEGEAPIWSSFVRTPCTNLQVKSNDLSAFRFCTSPMPRPWK